MKIAFYAPLKSPWHPVPSGDRLMARLIMQALERAGHEVVLASELRSFSKTPPADMSLVAKAKAERERIAAMWLSEGAPDLWFCYHPYYKAPDLLGPDLAARFELPYVTAEASYSERRNAAGWADSQALVLASVRQAAVNLCMTERDRRGLQDAAPDARLEHLPPFIDASLFAARDPQPISGRLMTIAMMRPGDKMESYKALASALSHVREPFHLRVAGDGEQRNAVAALFAGFPVEFLGQISAERIAEELSQASILVWPGCGEAYGLAYLEAQAAGVPVIAFDTAGVPEVVKHERTGLLTPQGDTEAYAAAISSLLADETGRTRLANGARAFVLGERTIDAAARHLDAVLSSIRSKT